MSQSSLNRWEEKGKERRRGERSLLSVITLVCLVDGTLEVLGLAEELSSDVDIGSARLHREAREQTALHELVRVVSHNLAILARARLALVCINNQVAGSGGKDK